MSETRLLRAKLEESQAELRRAKEHLEKLRAHQAREREPLLQELEAAQSEVAGLRVRLQKAEAPLSASVPTPVPSEPESEAPSGGATTALVALARSPASLEASLPALARVLQLSPVDVRFRLAPQLPAVVARLPLAQARALRAALRAEGFLAVSCPVVPRAEAGWVTVRHFELEEQGLRVEGMLGESLQVRYADLRLLMRGRQISTQVELREEMGAYVHTLRQRVRETIEAKQERVENFVWALGKGPRLAFTQSTHFNGLGDLRASLVIENLPRLAKELQRRAPHVAMDERFVQMPRFILPLVDPDRGQELLAELLLQAILEGQWP